MKSAIISLLLAFWVTPASYIFGQDGDVSRPVSYTVITNAGDTLTGSFDRWAGDTLILRSGRGELLRVRRTDFARLDESSIVLTEAEEQNDSVAELFSRTPASSLILSPTAWPKPDGHPVLGIYEFAFASAAVSVADLITVSGVTSFMNMFDRDGDIYCISMKISPVVRDNVALAAGVSFFEGYREYVRSTQLLHLTGSFMLGDVSFTAGYGLIREDAEAEGSMFYLGFDIPVTRSIRVLLELVNPNDYSLNKYLIGAAARFQLRRLLIECGALSDPESSRSFIAPWIGLGFIL